jgi:hypothetical protein
VDRRVLVLVLVCLGSAAAIFTALKMTEREKPAVAPRTMAAPPPPAPEPAPPPPAAVPESPAVATEPATPRRAPRTPAPVAPAAESAPAAAPATAILRIDSDVTGAQVFMDREYIGVTPLTARDVTPGTHRMNVSAEGYEGVAETIEVVPGPRDLVFKLREVRLNSSIDVIHKHRMGSCRGRLTATPQGLRYETTDKDDAFESGLMDLETFEVDYLAKNLKIKPRKGKRYEFTDPDGNADRLFVFHRDTEKARARLRKGDPAASR